ncbi:MAG TPA: immunoglobulin-like domain-containing protein, partial [Bacteroidia bacterium]|nr:immunoglobulin-like domain-containing protein [Bacteroidia bacterium]
MNRLISYAGMILLVLLGYSRSWGQAGSIDLKDGTGSVISSHASIKDAVAAIPSTISQAYVIEITGTYTGASEIFPIQFKEKSGASATNTITLRPASGVTNATIAGNNSTAVISIDSGDYVVIDGRAGGTGTSKNLSISNASTSASTGIMLINGATNNVIQYVNISNSSTASTSSCIRFNTSANHTSGNSNNVAANNKTTGGRAGIYFSGTTANPNTNNLVYGNEITNYTVYGIYSSGGNAVVKVDYNQITTPNGSGSIYGMYFTSHIDSLIITRNRIYNLVSSSTTGIDAMYISPSTSGVIPLRVINNQISLSSTTITSLNGIYILGSGQVEAQIYYNTVHISSTLASGSSNGTVASAAFYETNSDALSVYDIKNNIFSNERTGGATGAQHIAFAVSNTTGTFDLDFNTYYASSNIISRRGTATVIANNLADHQSLFSGDQNSNIKKVNFVSAHDLHLAGSSLGDEDLKALPLSAVKTDIDNDPRGTLTYKGADDNPAYPLPAPRNEIGVRSIDEPAAGTCNTTADVKVTVENFGVNQVDTFTVNWSIDGVLQTPVTFYTVLDTLLGAGSMTAQVTLGNMPLSATLATIKAWTSLPNNIVDNVKKNDSSQRKVRTGLAAGTYTIGGSTPDFATISEAAGMLNTYGVCGPVVFDIRSGTYNEKVAFGQIAGTSATNTVTFQSEALDSTAVIITSASSAAATNNYTIFLDGTDNIIFRYLTIEKTGAETNATVISIDGVAENVKISSNIIKGVSSSATDANGIRSGIFGALSATTKNIEIFNNYFENNSNGVWLNTTTNYSSGTKIYNNIIKANYTGIFAAGQHNPSIHHNDLSRFNTSYTIDFYGISVNLVDSGLYIAHNRVNGTNGYGIRLRDSHGFAGNEGRVINNMITMISSGTANEFGISLEIKESYLLIAHNTVYMNIDYTGTSTSNLGARPLYVPVVTANAYKELRVLNNIFYSVDNGVAFYISPGAATAMTELDYNLYYSGDPDEFSYVGAYQADFAAHQAITGKDKNSYNQSIMFVSSTDAHISFMQNYAYGKNGLNIPVDFDGDIRCASLPTVGADEYAVTLNAPVATFIGPSAAVTGDRSFFLFNGNLSQIGIYRWLVNGMEVAQGPNLTYAFPIAGTYDIDLIVENCLSNDTFRRSYIIADPTAEPTVNFSADRNQVFVNESVQFTDLSVNGPTKWHWSVSPNNGSVFFSDSTAQDPLILFTQVGKYEVCLIAENSIGAGTQRCRTAYIEVFPQISMCGETFSNAERGKLSDEGGPTGNFSDNTTCSFFINPCASEVNLKFKSWVNTDPQDILSIYDGDTTDPANLIATIPGGTVNPGGTTGFTAKSGRMWILWKTDASLDYAGFEAEWSSVPASVNPTVASFDIPDTAFVSTPINFKNTSSGSGLLFFWDFDTPNYEPDDNFAYNKVNPVKTYSFPGTYNVLLESTNCLGKDTVIKPIVIINPTSAPVPDFTASLNKFGAGETIQLFDQSAQGPTSWMWEITPSAGVAFIDAATSKNPRVIIGNAGIYTVKLVATNNIGSDSIIKTAYLEALDYCLPNVSNLNTDVTIRRVVFEDIDHSSDYGVNRYNNFIGMADIAEVTEGGAYNISIERNTNNERVNFAVWIDYNQDGVFDNATERALFDSAITVQVMNSTITIPAGATLGETRMRVAISRANLTTLPCGPVVVGEYEDYKIRIVVDDLAPVITLLGPNPDFIEVGYGFTDSGAAAIDNVDGNISSNITKTGSVDTLTVGTYVITYKIIDARGNTDSVQRVVNITPDVTAPVLTLNGNATETIEVFSSYTEQGGSAIDNPFGSNLTDSIKI